MFSARPDAKGVMHVDLAHRLRGRCNYSPMERALEARCFVGGIISKALGKSKGELAGRFAELWGHMP